jgi:hypothetical protein
MCLLDSMHGEHFSELKVATQTHKFEEYGDAWPGLIGWIRKALGQVDYRQQEESRLG